MKKESVPNKDEQINIKHKQGSLVASNGTNATNFDHNGWTYFSLLNNPWSVGKLFLLTSTESHVIERKEGNMCEVKGVLHRHKISW